MFIKGTFAEKNAILTTAEKMCAAAKTAPKGRGIDKIVCAVVTGDDKEALSERLEKMGKEGGIDFYIRDANNLNASEAVVLIGTTSGPRGLSDCGYCGFHNCADMSKAGGRCAFDDIDLGIAIGSAVSIAADNRIDNRIMFSAGRAAMELGLLGEAISKIFAIPLSTTGKSPYFDR